MVKVYVASFHRATNGAISKLVKELKRNDMYCSEADLADYILAVADRKETFDFVLEQYRKNKPIIHLFAGEKSCWATHDDVYRHAITLMSKIQLCTNNTAKERVKALCKSVGKTYFASVVGNVMLDNLEIDESEIPNRNYDLILYNPPVRSSTKEIIEELEQIDKIKKPGYICIEPNGDCNSDLVRKRFIINKTFPRPKFLGLLKNCDRFITNSSCQYYEAQFLLKPEQIISIGLRNTERESKYSDMSIKNATENIIKILRSL